jgi:hypothetical protein
MSSVRKYMVALCSFALVPMVHASQSASQPAEQPVKQEQRQGSGEYKKPERTEKTETNEREGRGIVHRTWDSAKDIAHSAWRSVKRVFGYE